MTSLTMAEMQQLFTLSRYRYVVMSLELDITYKIPSQKTRLMATFFLVRKCRVEITGSGRHRTRTSRAMLVPTLAKPTASTSYRQTPTPVYAFEIGSPQEITSFVGSESY